MKKLLLLLFFIPALVKAQLTPIIDTTTLRTYINNEIVTNGTKAITAVKLNRILNGYLNVWPGNNYPTSLSYSNGLLTMIRNGLPNLTTPIASDRSNTEIRGIYRYDFTGIDSTDVFNSTTDGTLSFTKTALGLRSNRSDTAPSFFSNRYLLKSVGQVWGNKWKQEFNFVPNFTPSSTTKKIGLAITGVGDNQLSAALSQTLISFGFIVRLGSDANSSGFQVQTSTTYYGTNNAYAANFYNGFLWRQGDSIKLTVEQFDNNAFKVQLSNRNTGSVVNAFLNQPLLDDDNPQRKSTEPGYFSIVTNGGDFYIKDYTVNLLTEGVQAVVIGTSITYGYGLGSYTYNNNQSTWYYKVKDSLQYRTMLLAKGGITTVDANKTLKQLLAYKPKYVIIDGIQTNDFFVTDTTTSKANYLAFVNTLKSYGIAVVHIVPSPRGYNDALYHQFQYACRNWIKATFTEDLIVDDYTSLLQSATTNTLKSTYYSEGDGTHLNVAGHAVRYAAVLAAMRTVAPPIPFVASIKISNDSLYKKIGITWYFVGMIGGSNIATGPQRATGDYVHDWDNRTSTFNSIGQWNLVFSTDGMGLQIDGNLMTANFNRNADINMTSAPDAEIGFTAGGDFRASAQSSDDEFRISPTAHTTTFQNNGSDDRFTLDGINHTTTIKNDGQEVIIARADSTRFTATKLKFEGAVYFNVSTATDANYTVTPTDFYITLPQPTADRGIFLPSASDNKGRMIVFRNNDVAGGFGWGFSEGTVYSAAFDLFVVPVDITTTLFSNGTKWVVLGDRN